jgi:hypothetical protein
MAVTKTILKNANNESIVKVAGTAAAATIDLSADLVSSTQALDGATQTVNIAGLVWTGAADGIITITRNSVVVTTLQANASGALDFTGQMMVPETIENTSDIVVTISGAQSECWIRLRKTGGYADKVETGIYGSYDDTTRVGAKTTVTGSPDYVAT